MAEESGDAKGRVIYSGTWKLEGTKGVALKVISTIELLVTLSGMNQTELAAAMGIGEGTLSEYLSGKRPVGPTGIRQFAKALKVSPEILAKGEGLSLENVRDEIVDRLDKQAKADKVSEPAVSPETYAANVVPIDRVSLLDRRLRRHLIRSVERSEDNTEAVRVYRTAAGRPDEPDATPEPQPVWVPKSVRDAAGKARMFGLRVSGNSMVDAGIEDGDIVLARRSSTRPADGRIVVVHLAGEGNTCKRLRGNELVAESPVHEDIRILDDTFAAEVVAIYKPEK